MRLDRSAGGNGASGRVGGQVGSIGGSLGTFIGLGRQRQGPGPGPGIGDLQGAVLLRYWASLLGPMPKAQGPTLRLAATLRVDVGLKFTIYWFTL